MTIFTLKSMYVGLGSGTERLLLEYESESQRVWMRRAAMIWRGADMQAPPATLIEVLGDLGIVTRADTSTLIAFIDDWTVTEAQPEGHAPLFSDLTIENSDALSATKLSFPTDPSRHFSLMGDGTWVEHDGSSPTVAEGDEVSSDDIFEDWAADMNRIFDTTAFTSACKIHYLGEV